MHLNPKFIKENDDEDICIYVLNIEERNFMYKSSWMMYCYHEGERQFPWTNSSGFDDMPKDGDICKFYGREIIISPFYICVSTK